MKYNKIRCMDISNGPGVRVSIFFQGCHFHCKGCFNEDTWDFNGGKPFTEETIEYIIELLDQDHYQGLSILGGEPLHPYNIGAVVKLCKRCKEKYPEKDIWLWTGYEFELKEEFLLNSPIDVAVCGPFILEQRDLTLKYCGSRNQQVIDLNSLRKQ